MDILKIVESRLKFLPKPDDTQSLLSTYLLTSLIDKLFKININLRPFCIFFDPVTLIHVW